MSTITIHKRVNQILDVDVDLDDIIDYLTDRPTTEKLNFCAQIINGLSSDLKDLSPEHLDIFRDWLKERLSEIEANTLNKQ